MEIAVIVSTFERPGHLARCLASLAAQRGVDGLFEVVVTDDGSRDETLQLVSTMARLVRFPLTFTTHAHAGFRLARCRNEGAAATTAPYLLFTDGDCILPPDHIRIHLAVRRPGRVVAGDCIRLDDEASALVDAPSLLAGRFPARVPFGERMRLALKAARAKAYEACRTPLRPRLSGNNIGVWRGDFERVNGFDEAYVGWGFEDRDLQVRLERLGLRPWSVLARTAPIHLWHEPAPTFARNGLGTTNLDYFRMIDARPTFCVDGLTKSIDRPAVVPIRRMTREAARRAA